MSLPVFGVVGWKNSGKTTLMTKLIAEFAGQGLDVAAIKHAHHGFDVDHEGRDSFRFRSAGARRVVVASPVRVAIMTELQGRDEPSLPELLTHVASADLILIEGFKASPHPKIELRRMAAVRTVPLPGDIAGVRAIAADFPIDGETRPVLHLDDTAAIAAFILAELGLARRVA